MILARSIILLFLLLLTGRAPGETVSTTIEVFADGNKSPLLGPEITVAHDTSALRFFVKPKTLRTRYRLPSLDSEWKERANEMFFVIRFLKKNGDPISEQGFPAVGTSLGWKGSWEKSLFTPRREMVTVPPGASSFYVVISSAGPPALVGVYAVSGIDIQSVKQGGVPGVIHMQDSRRPDSNQKIWKKSGTHSSMASSLNLDAGDMESPVLIINDDDVKGHADWNTGIYSLPPVVAGERLEVKWSEAYNSGLGGSFSAEYARLPAGIHLFEVEELSMSGTPLGVITSVSVIVPQPFWLNIWFWTAVVGTIAIFSTLGGRYLIRKKITRHLEEAQLISDERLRIARDLHDDLGTRLSHISLLSSFAQSSSPSPEVSSNFEQISAMSRELIGALSETVWMLNPKNNQLEALVDFLCRLVSELCRLANIRCRIDALSVTGNVLISHDFRHNVCLAVKEIVNNALKHSGATEITMTIRVDGKCLIIIITDNGIGITPDAGKPGVGLDSINQRMTSIRGKCYIETIESGGLKVTLEASIA